MNNRELKQRKDAIDNAWRRDGDPNTSDVDQAQAKAKAAATQRDWDQRAKPTPNRDRLLEPWQRETDVSDAPRTDSRDEIPAHILEMCPPDRRPVKRADGGYTFELVSSGTRADAKTKVTRFG